ncbi:hypothetical protein R4P64_29045 [Rhodococcus sp. IEGM 1366]|uniref:hypothetical protein n=1 Tax=Rhodococcus sp. IEGM 1366 TaxID=3082223 RepID=UPI002952AB05|nr:hypothetical protein [Rhodococcus sp. IEGM 1366]MDV8070588.1 hypothetical protein [Rhodococcus sp. IEGM 1366]
MTDSNTQRDDPVAVGSRVKVISSSGSRSSDTASRFGVVLEDYADAVIDNSDLGRDWAPVQRWAIALDDGRLVSAADGGLELA